MEKKGEGRREVKDKKRTEKKGEKKQWNRKRKKEKEKAKESSFKYHTVNLDTHNKNLSRDTKF